MKNIRMQMNITGVESRTSLLKIDQVEWIKM